MADRADKDCVIGVDMGGTNVLAGVVDGDYNVLAANKVKTRVVDGPDVALGQLGAAIRGVLEGKFGNRVAAIGLGIPGPVDAERGIVTVCPNLGWTNTPVAGHIKDTFGLPAYVDNDVNVGTLGEVSKGAAQGMRDVVGIFIGTGIGGGVVLGGKLHRGMNGTAGEIGHMVITSKGKLPAVKGKGYLEAVASRTAIVDYIVSKREKGKKTVITEPEAHRITSGKLRKAVKAGDELAQMAILRSARYVGDVCSAITHLICPQMFVLGGGVMDVMPEEYLAIVRRILKRRALGHSARGVQVVAGTLGDDAGVIGAAVLARQEMAAEGA